MPKWKSIFTIIGIAELAFSGPGLVRALSTNAGTMIGSYSIGPDLMAQIYTAMVAGGIAALMVVHWAGLKHLSGVRRRVLLRRENVEHNERQRIIKVLRETRQLVGTQFLRKHPYQGQPRGAEALSRIEINLDELKRVGLNFDGNPSIIFDHISHVIPLVDVFGVEEARRKWQLRSATEG